MSFLFGPENSTGTNTANTPAYDHTPVAGELLLLFLEGNGTTAPTTPTGWTLVKSVAGNAGCRVSLWSLVAVGSDAAPTIPALAGVAFLARLCQITGAAASAPLDHVSTSGTTGTTSPGVVANSATDTAANEIVVAASVSHYTAGATKTLTNTITTNSVAVTGQVDANNNAAASQDHYCWSVALTANNAAADSNSFAFTTGSVSGSCTIIASFLLAAAVTQKGVLAIL